MNSLYFIFLNHSISPVHYLQNVLHFSLNNIFSDLFFHLSLGNTLIVTSNMTWLPTSTYSQPSIILHENIYELNSLTTFIIDGSIHVTDSHSKVTADFSSPYIQGIVYRMTTGSLSLTSLSLLSSLPFSSSYNLSSLISFTSDTKSIFVSHCNISNIRNPSSCGSFLQGTLTQNTNISIYNSCFTNCTSQKGGVFHFTIAEYFPVLISSLSIESCVFLHNKGMLFSSLFFFICNCMWIIFLIISIPIQCNKQSFSFPIPFTFHLISS